MKYTLKATDENMYKHSYPNIDCAMFIMPKSVSNTSNCYSGFYLLTRTKVIVPYLCESDIGYLKAVDERNICIMYILYIATYGALNYAHYNYMENKLTT